MPFSTCMALTFAVSLLLMMDQRPALADGAFAWGDCGVLGTASHFENEHEAALAAVRDCRANGGNNCRVATTFRRGMCVAVATDETGETRERGACGTVSSWGKASNGDEAQRVAINTCRRDSGGGRCKARGVICDVARGGRTRID